MERSSQIDPLALDSEFVAFHQALSLSTAGRDTTGSFETSPLFRVTRHESAAVCEWVRRCEEDDATFPLGRVVVTQQGHLFEALSEDRLAGLQVAAHDTIGTTSNIDQVRVFPIADAIERPTSLLQPVHDLESRALTSREVARDYLRMAWPFLPREDLAGRAPHVVVRTGRGRAQIRELLPVVLKELRRSFPAFPSLDPEEVGTLLLTPTPGEDSTSEESQHSAKDSRIA